MFSKRRSFSHRLFVSASIALPLCLSACGGGSDGSFVASAPPPPATPTPTPTPAATTTLEAQVTWLDRAGTKIGSSEVIGQLKLGNGAPTDLPGPATMSIARVYPALPDLSYTLSVPAGILPVGISNLTATSPEITWGSTNDAVNPQLIEGGGKWVQDLGQRLVEYRVHSDGSREEAGSYDFLRGHTFTSQPYGTNGYLNLDFTYDVGFSYVAMGEWSWKTVDLNGATTGTGDLLFANGDRTPPSSIPVSGTATYDAHTLSLLTGSWFDSSYPGIHFNLTADFGLRTIATRIDQDYHYYTEPGGYVGAPIPSVAAILGIHVGGSAPFSNDGMFNIPLTGTVNYSATNAPDTPPSQAVTGGMNGAFFGPHAEEVGGTFSLQNSAGAVLAQDAFVGKQH